MLKHNRRHAEPSLRTAKTLYNINIQLQPITALVKELTEELNANKPDRHGHLRDHEEREEDRPGDVEDGEENLGKLHSEAAKKREQREKRCAECRKSFRSDECGQAEGESKAEEQLKVGESWRDVNRRRNQYLQSLLAPDCAEPYNQCPNDQTLR